MTGEDTDHGPAEAADGGPRTYPVPPRTVTVKGDLCVDIRKLQDLETLVEMYGDFSPEDRAQGIPPSKEDAIRDWLDIVTAPDCLNVVARHDDRTVGHAMLVADDGSHELAIFVLQDYQGAGIGTELLETTLGAAREAGFGNIWLSVERWNRPAIALYRKVGFEPAESGNFEKEMRLELEAAG